LRNTKILTTLFITCLAGSAFAANEDNWKHFSDIGAYGLVTVALVTPEIKGDREGFKQAAYSVIAASTIGLIGKTTIDEERPDKTSNDSFPSNHTANSFASATTLYRRYGWEYGVPAYCIAAMVGNGRVEARRHHWRDVLAGAALGTSTGWYFTDKFDSKTQLSAWLGDNAGGVVFSQSWN